MIKGLIFTFLFSITGCCFAANTSSSVAAADTSALLNGKKIVLAFLLKDDFQSWIASKPSLYNWSSTADQSALVSKSSVAPHILYNAFEANAFSAEKRYSKVPQKINGVIYSVKKDSNGEPLLTFITRHYQDNFIASGLTKSEVSNAKRGDKIDLICYGFEYDNYFLYSNKCTTETQFYDQLSSRFAKDLISKSVTFKSAFENDGGDHDKITDVILSKVNNLNSTKLAEIGSNCWQQDFLFSNKCEFEFRDIVKDFK